LGSREEIEGGVEPLPALPAPLMTAAIIHRNGLSVSTEYATILNFSPVDLPALWYTVFESDARI
jgi:hypothetical protein